MPAPAPVAPRAHANGASYVGQPITGDVPALPATPIPPHPAGADGTCQYGSDGCVVMAVTDALYPIAQVTKTRFPNTYPGTQINVRLPMDAVDAEQTLLSDGPVDLVGAAWPCPAGIAQASDVYACHGDPDKTGKPQLEETFIGRDALSIFISNDKDRRGCEPAYLTKNDVLGLWFGLADGTPFDPCRYPSAPLDPNLPPAHPIRYWNQLSQGSGCPALPITLYAANVSSDDRQALIGLNWYDGPGWSQAFGGTMDAQEQAWLTIAKGTRGNSADIVTAVRNNPYAIGYASLHYDPGSGVIRLPLSWASYKAGVEPDACQRDGVSGPAHLADAIPPSTDTVADKCYPMSRYLHLFGRP
jgi:ABC-type phosphate transport system substrate-binding protein